MLSVCIFKVVTFQLVLVSNVHRTFILINYGDIAQTEQIWLVSGNRSLLLLQRKEMRRNCPCLTSSHTFLQKTVMSGTGWGPKNNSFTVLLQAGYNTADSVNSFTIPVSSAPDLSSSSNINVNGRSSFHVDGSPKCKPMRAEAQAWPVPFMGLFFSSSSESFLLTCPFLSAN